MPDRRSKPITEDEMSRRCFDCMSTGNKGSDACERCLLLKRYERQQEARNAWSGRTP